MLTIIEVDAPCVVCLKTKAAIFDRGLRLKLVTSGDFQFMLTPSRVAATIPGTNRRR
jgi:hypothetical protein